MQQESGGKGAWIGFVLALVLAIVFLVLWLMRGGEVDRLATALRSSQDSAASTSRRLEDDLQRARGDLDAANRRAGELEGRIRDEQRRAAEAVRQAESRLRSEVDATSSQLRSANSELSELRSIAEAAANAGFASSSEAARLRRELESANHRLTESKNAAAALESRAAKLEANLTDLQKRHDTARQDLDKALSAARENTEAANLSAELMRMELELAATKNANAALEELRNRLSQTMEQEREKARQTEDDLRKRLEERAAAPASADAAASQARPDEQTRARLRELGDRIGQLTARERELAGRVAALESEAAELRGQNALLDAQRDSLQARLQAATVAGRQRLEDLGNRAAAAEKARADAEKARADGERELRAQIERERAECRKRVEALEKPADTPAPGAPEGAGGPAPVIVGDPGRSVGRVVEMMPDGSTFLINGGSKHRVQPGMKFDVHRSEGGRRRYIGMVRVTRAMENYSMAVMDNPAGAKVCPVTGRAVLEPDARFSPYALAADGSPVPLVAADGTAQPDIGDYIDNPFFDPLAAKLIALSPDLADSGAVARVVQAMGNTPCLNTGDPGSAEILLMNRIDASPAGDGLPRPASTSHLFNYWNAN